MKQQSIYDMYPKFYNHPFIKSIKDNNRWTFSTNTKIPVDIYTLRYKNIIVGADPDMPGSMDTLDETIKLVNYPNNHAYYINSDYDDFLVLDIEPICPEDIKTRLLKLPYLYAEKSMSKKGLHLVLPRPTNFNDFENAKVKNALKHKAGYYEILINHWVTFTRDQLEDSANSCDLSEWDKIYAHLAENQNNANKVLTDVELTGKTIEEIPDSDIILDILINANHYQKEPRDFNNDMSKYEMGFMGYKYYKLSILLKSSILRENKHDYSPEEKTLILYEIAKECLEHRDKHDEARQNMPWLMYLAKTVVERTENPERK